MAAVEGFATAVEGEGCVGVGPVQDEAHHGAVGVNVGARNALGAEAIDDDVFGALCGVVGVGPGGVVEVGLDGEGGAGVEPVFKGDVGELCDEGFGGGGFEDFEGAQGAASDAGGDTGACQNGEVALGADGAGEDLEFGGADGLEFEAQGAFGAASAGEDEGEEVSLGETLGRGQGRVGHIFLRFREPSRRGSGRR